MSSKTALASSGLSQARTKGMTISMAMVGTRLKLVKTVALNGKTSPVSFCTTFMALPGVDCARAIELDMPLAHITQPENPAATIQAKSTRMRLATSRASRALTTRPKPQLQNDASATRMKVSAAAWLGVRAMDTKALSTRCTGGACANAWPVTSTSVIWKAKVRMSKNPLYQPPTRPPNESCGANNMDSTATMAVIRMARTKGSGMVRSNSAMVASVKRVLRTVLAAADVVGFMLYLQ